MPKIEFTTRQAAQKHVRRTVKHETTVVKAYDHALWEDDVSVQYWNTEVVTYHEDGSVTLDSGGYYTPTTKKRMNTYQSLGTVFQEDFEWYVETAMGTFDFFNGIRILPNGDVAENRGVKHGRYRKP